MKVAMDAISGRKRLSAVCIYRNLQCRLPTAGGLRVIAVSFKLLFPLSFQVYSLFLGVIQLEIRNRAPEVEGKNPCRSHSMARYLYHDSPALDKGRTVSMCINPSVPSIHIHQAWLR